MGFWLIHVSVPIQTVILWICDVGGPEGDEDLPKLGQYHIKCHDNDEYDHDHDKTNTFDQNKSQDAIFQEKQQLYCSCK